MAISLTVAQRVGRWASWGLVVAWSLAARFRLAAGYEGNYDQESYGMVVDAMARGASAYSTGRYNYSPLWSWILALLGAVRDWTGLELHTVVRSFLTLVDLGTAIAIFLYCRARGRHPFLASLLFLVNPITLYVTGYHGQFDNLSLLFVVLALLRWTDDDSARGNRDLLTGGLLGLSILIKHVTLFVPFVFLPRVRGWRRRAWFLLACYAPFALTLLPYWIADPDLVLKLVFRYQGGIVNWGLRPILASLGIAAPDDVYRTGLMLALLAAALLWSLGDVTRGCLLSMLGLLVFSPSFANQYLVWPVALGALVLSPLYVAFLFFGGSFIWGPVSARGPQLGAAPHSPPWLDWALMTDQRVLWSIAAIWFGAVVVEWARTAKPVHLRRRQAAIAAAALVAVAAAGLALFLRAGRPQITIACDDAAEVFVDGEKAGAIERWERPLVLPFPAAKDRVLVAVDAVNRGGAGGLIGIARSRSLVAVTATRAEWVCATAPTPGWTGSDFDDRSWRPPRLVARYGDPPWSSVVGAALGGAEWVWGDAPASGEDRLYCRWWAPRPGETK